VYVCNTTTALLPFNSQLLIIAYLEEDILASVLAPFLLSHAHLPYSPPLAPLSVISDLPPLLDYVPDSIVDVRPSLPTTPDVVGINHALYEVDMMLFLLGHMAAHWFG
jgi:hypothetical protein